MVISIPIELDITVGPTNTAGVEEAENGLLDLGVRESPIQHSCQMKKKKKGVNNRA